MAVTKPDMPGGIARETRYTLPRPLPRTARNPGQLKLTGIDPRLDAAEITGRVSLPVTPAPQYKERQATDKEFIYP